MGVLAPATSSTAQLPPNQATEVRLNRQQAPETWSYYTRDYRKHHNLALVGLAGKANFQVNSFGSLNSKVVTKPLAGGRLHYSYHVPISRKVGYLLGSGMGFTQYLGNREDFKIEDTVIVFPGLLGGLDYNFDPQWRVIGFVNINLERFDRIREEDPGLDGSGKPNTTISVTMYGIDQGLAVDHFVDIRWAIRGEFHIKRLYYERPKSPQGHEVNANIKESETWYGLGINYHLL